MVDNVPTQTALEVICRRVVLLQDGPGSPTGYWHPRAQPRWKDFEEEGRDFIKALSRAGWRIVPSQKRTKKGK